MSINVFKKIALLGFMAVSTSVFAGPLNDYNLILSGDLAVSGGSGHVEGKSFIGGNLQQGSVFSGAVKVVGNLNDTSIQVQTGNLDYQGANNMGVAGTAAVCPSGACVHKITDGSLTTEKTSIFSQLQAESTFYKNLASSSNIQITGDNNNKTFRYTGAATDLVVFNLTSAQFLSTNAWDMDFGNALRVLVNVSGTSISNVGQGGNLANDSRASQVLWNFYEATSINLQREWYGSILALDATINTNSNLTGSIAAKSYTGNGEIHDGYWSYNPPKTNVPEPSSLLLSLFGLGLVLLGRARRQK